MEEVVLANSADRAFENLATNQEAAIKNEIRGLQSKLRELDRRPLKTTTDYRVQAKSPETRSSFTHKLNVALSNPEFVRLMRKEQVDYIKNKYRKLFVELGLDNEQIAAAEDLLLQKQDAKTDALLASNALGITALNDLGGTREKAVLLAQRDADSGLRQVLGDSGFAQYQYFESSTGVRSTVDVVQQALSYTKAPLTDKESADLVFLWSGAMPVSNRDNSTGVDAEGAAGLLPAQRASLFRPQIPKGGIEIAQAFLKPEQVAAIQELVNIQDAESRLRTLATKH